MSQTSPSPFPSRFSTSPRNISIELDGSNRRNLYENVRQSLRQIVPRKKSELERDDELSRSVARLASQKQVVNRARENGKFHEKYSGKEAMLGEGQQGTVFVTTRLCDDAKFAVKIVPNRFRIDTSTMTEVLILERLKNVPGVLRIEEIFLDEEYLYLVTELVEGLDLQKWWALFLLVNTVQAHFSQLSLAMNGPMQEFGAKLICRQVCQSLMKANDCGVVHRDVKLENIMLDENTLSITLIDWGCSEELGSGRTGCMKVKVGTPGYQAPEMFGFNTNYTYKVDLFSLGVVLYCLLSNRMPFNPDNRLSLVEEFDRARLGIFSFDYPVWDSVDPAGKELISRLLQADPNKRMSYEEVLHHAWLIDENEE